MVTEFEIRREFLRISSSDHAPLRKARLLLRLARKVRSGIFRLASLKDALMQDCMNEQAARMHDAAKRLTALHDEIRRRASEILGGKHAHGFEYNARNAAYPAWTVRDERQWEVAQ